MGNIVSTSYGLQGHHHNHEDGPFNSACRDRAGGQVKSFTSAHYLTGRMISIPLAFISKEFEQQGFSWRTIHKMPSLQQQRQPRC